MVLQNKPISIEGRQEQVWSSDLLLSLRSLSKNRQVGINGDGLDRNGLSDENRNVPADSGNDFHVGEIPGDGNHNGWCRASMHAVFHSSKGSGCIVGIPGTRHTRHNQYRNSR
tara:strand:+ start:3042 stop:3380 length:339 start_codon:yes stop_codon:yes gene_type:complete